MSEMATIGFAAIAIGWYLQLKSTKKKHFALQRGFLAAYVIGAALLTLDSFGAFGLGTIFNAASAAFAFLIYRKMGKKS